MSVKSKVKRCNKEIKRLQDELETYKLSNNRLREKCDNKVTDETLENIIKFLLTNHIGGLNAAMRVDAINIDKLKDLRLSVYKDNLIDGRSYIIKVGYYN